MPRSPRTQTRTHAVVAAAALATAAGCGGGKDLSLTASAKVDGNFVVITASCSQRADVEAAGISGACTPEAPLTLRVPAQQIGTGPKKVAVTMSAVGKRATVEVAVDVPASATGPYFLVTKCGGDSGEFLDLDDSGRKFQCHTAGGARLKLSIQATPGAKLTIGGQTVGVPDGGQFELGVDLGEGILALPVDDLLSDASEGPRLVLPWKLDAAGKPLEGKLTASVKFGSHKQVMWQWLRDFADGKIDRPAFTPRAEGRQTALRVPTEKFAKLGLTDRRGTVREIGLIAVEREARRIERGTCKFESKGKIVTVKRLDVPVEVKVINTADGKPVTTKVFPAPADCPSFAFMRSDRPEVAVRVADTDVMKWLDTLTEPGAAAAAGSAGGSAAEAPAPPPAKTP